MASVAIDLESKGRRAEGLVATEVELVRGDDVGHTADARVELFISELADDLHALHLRSIGSVLFADKADDDKVGLRGRYPQQVSAWVL